MNKKKLYESIMRNVAIEVKKALNEGDMTNLIQFDDDQIQFGKQKNNFDFQATEMKILKCAKHYDDILQKEYNEVKQQLCSISDDNIKNVKSIMEKNNCIVSAYSDNGFHFYGPSKLFEYFASKNTKVNVAPDSKHIYYIVDFLEWDLHTSIAFKFETNEIARSHTNNFVNKYKQICEDNEEYLLLTTFIK